ncbi:MAG TPA: cytochrome c oxidase subunit 3 [Gammaproteobacteria bacterium]
MLTALLIAMLTGITIWWLLVQRLKTKPWTEQGVIPGSQDSLTSSAPKVGLFVFLAMVTSLFLVFVGAYIMRKDHGHGGGMHVWMPVDDPNVLWLNTVLLVLASAALQHARGRMSHEDVAAARRSFAAGGVLTVLFLAGQVSAWVALSSTGLYTVESPAYSFFILLTAVHGLHLVGGLVVLARAALRMARADTSNVVVTSGLVTSVELCTTYWHFLLLVWLGLFWLLLST